jgi:two-component sensor histidine kinase
LKGLARSIGCRHLSVAIHSIEDCWQARPQDIGPASSEDSLIGLRQLLARYEDLWIHKLKRGQDHREDNQSSLIEELAYRRQQIRESSHVAAHLPELLKTLDRYIQQSLYTSLFALLRELTESMAPLAAELNRIPPEIQLEGCDHWIHRRGANVLRMALVHLIRNALDHGLESPAERQSKGKNPRGRIIWSVKSGSGSISISCRDDGRGLEIEALIKKALELGYSRDDLEALPHGIADAMFISGLSSRETVSEVSGRGVGMDALRIMMGEAGGRVWARLLPADQTILENNAFETIIELPADLFLVMHDPIPKSA